jgi:hypothetical protein
VRIVVVSSGIIVIIDAASSDNPNPLKHYKFYASRRCRYRALCPRRVLSFSRAFSLLPALLARILRLNRAPLAQAGLATPGSGNDSAHLFGAC